MTGVGSETMNVSPRAPGLVGAVSTAELKFLIESTDRRAVKPPSGSGIGSRDILDIQPTELHQRTPLIIGSKRDVAFAQSLLKKA